MAYFEKDLERFIAKREKTAAWLRQKANGIYFWRSQAATPSSEIKSTFGGRIAHRIFENAHSKYFFL